MMATMHSQRLAGRIERPRAAFHSPQPEVPARVAHRDRELQRLQVHRLLRRLPGGVLLPDEMMLYIDPQDCIDCEACVPECPVEAIFAEANVPAQWASYTQLNADKATALKGSGWHITEKQDAKEVPDCSAKK